MVNDEKCSAFSAPFCVAKRNKKEPTRAAASRAEESKEKIRRNKEANAQILARYFFE